MNILLDSLDHTHGVSAMACISPYAIALRQAETGRMTLEQKTLGGVKKIVMNCLSFHLLHVFGFAFVHLTIIRTFFL